MFSAFRVGQRFSLFQIKKIKSIRYMGSMKWSLKYALALNFSPQIKYFFFLVIIPN